MILLISLLLLAACGGSPTSKARKVWQAADSWEATARLTAEVRRDGSVPTEYARQTAGAARQELEQLRQSAVQLSGKSEHGAELVRRVDSATVVVSRIFGPYTR